MAELTHFDERGASRMVDVSEKEVTRDWRGRADWSGCGRRRWP